MIVYIDITQLEKQRVNTGIQRVVKEFLQKAITKDKTTTYKIIRYNQTLKKMQLLQNKEVELFLKDIKYFNFSILKTINIESIKATQTTLFFDIDSPWNAPYKRDKLYPTLKKNGFLIFNLIYDLIPIVLAQHVQKIVVENYKSYIQTVYNYSDFTMCISESTKKDFLSYKTSLNINRYIPTKVVGLGSDFLRVQNSSDDKIFNHILEKKYILFVGTLEPRKNQEDVLDAFEILSNKYDDINLVFIGMKGWNQDQFFHRLDTHPLRDKRLFWLKNIDDATLYHFYENAFLVTYLSKYEGYGLPIVESLQHANITITSNNTSMPEVGSDFADYVDDNNQQQLLDKISLYLDDENLYKQRKAYIKENFRFTSWDQFAQNIFTILKSYNKPTLKEKIKSIPFIGFFSRWIYNLARLNNLKYKIDILEEKLKQQTQNPKPKNPQLDNFYVAFEDKFRGSRVSILKRYESYLKYIDPMLDKKKASTVKSLDIGCGRGEWVELLQKRDIDASGIDMNKSILAVAKKNGVKNTHLSDATSYLKNIKDNTYDIVTAFHIIEHIPYEKLFELIQEIKRVSKKDAVILLETPNPKNLEVATYSFYLDPTHLNPLPAQNIKFMVEYIGFKEVSIEYINPSTSPQDAKDYIIIAKGKN